MTLALPVQPQFMPPLEPSHNVFSATPNPLDALLKPRSVAIVGATEKPGSVGRTILWNMISSGFSGTVYPVNPKRDAIMGIKAYPSLSAIPDTIDLAVFVTPAATIPALVEEAGQKGIPGAIVISAGFKEVGPEGVAREQAILATAQRYGMRLIGPNCLGVMNTACGLNATFAAAMATPGHVGFLSQSGALCTAVLDWSLTNHVGFSVFASIGSMLDVDWGDLITYLGDDPATTSIVIYMETIGNAQSFLTAAREVALEKPIIVIKPGRTESAAKAAASHTGSLVGSDAVLDAAFRRCGVLRVDTIEELFAMADVLDKQPLPKGPKLNIITNAGGPGVIATDALLLSGGELATPSEATIAALNPCLPDAWSHGNPIDILGDASPERYAETLSIVNADDQSDGTLVILTPQAMTQPRETARALTKSWQQGDKPILASWMGGNDVVSGTEALTRQNIPCFQYPDTAARTFATMWRYRKTLDSLYETPSDRDLDGLAEVPVAQISQGLQAIAATGRTTLTELESKRLLANYQFPVGQIAHATTADEAVALAEQYGYPVVMKLHSTTITHKSDVGGVQLNLQSATAVREAFARIETNLAERGLTAQGEGVTLQPMIRTKGGTELLLGASTDPQFGPVLAFGAGGTYVELFGDVSFALPPLNSTLARRCMETTKIYKALQGIRGNAPVPMAQLEALMVWFSYLVLNHPEIAEVEINPLLASAEGFSVLDARVILHPAETFASGAQPRHVIRPYPSQYRTSITLPGNETLTVRPVRASDEPAIRAFHGRLTDDSVVQSYTHAFPLRERTAHGRLSRICFNDYSREMTLVAVDEQSPERPIVAVARLSRQHANPTTALFRLMIEDRFQRRGLGKALMTQMLAVAKAEGLTQVVGRVLAGNTPMLGLTQQFGFVVVPTQASNGANNIADNDTGVLTISRQLTE